MARLKHHDGLSRTVVAERRTPYEPAPDDICDARFTGDRFVSTYTYGPMGVINRYEENNNSNPGDDQILWYLSDAMGGHVHVLVDRPLPDPEVDRPPPTVNTLNTDAFGVRKGAMVHACVTMRSFGGFHAPAVTRLACGDQSDTYPRDRSNKYTHPT